jgi:hypothetical protein
MSSLFLRLHKESVETSIGAVATLQRVANESGEAVARGQRFDVTIPANSGASAHQVTVDPGRWLVEATLPSGEVISEEVAVASGEDLPVTLHSAEHSPHEWLGMQYLVGNIEGAETLKRLRSKPTDSLRTLSGNQPGFAADQNKAARRTRASIEPPNAYICQEQAALRGAEAWTSILSPDLGAFTACAPSMADPGEATWLYQIAGTAQRRFAYVEWIDERYAVSLPLPWAAVRDNTQASAQIMVRIDPRQDDIRIGVIVEDPDFAPMAGLMTASTLSRAAVAVNQARDLLFGKMLHPLGAAAGGYVLLAAGDREDDSWHAWIDNLANWFPDIPDGAILKASLRLRFPKSRSSAEEARSSLLDAFDRGIPYYSAGVSWLLDGLTQFADDPAVEEKLKIVHRVALRLDLSQAFTVIRVSDRKKQ